MSKPFDEFDHTCMQAAMEEARKAADADEVPVGAVLVDPSAGTILARAGNRTITQSDPTAHAEILVIREVAKMRGVQRLPELDLYVTLEPCAMCAAALSFARIRKVFFAAGDPKGGAVLHGPQFFGQPTCHHRPEISNGLMQQESSALLKDFFRRKRRKD